MNKQLVIKAIAKVLTVVILWLLILAIIETPVLMNDVALKQMNGDNIEYMAYAGFQAVRHYLVTGVNIIGAGTVLSILAKTIQNVFKNKKGE